MRNMGRSTEPKTSKKAARRRQKAAARVTGANDRPRCPGGSATLPEASISCRSGLLCERSDGHTRERPRSQGAVVRHQFQFRANLRTTSAYQIMNRKCGAKHGHVKATMDADRALRQS